MTIENPTQAEIKDILNSSKRIAVVGLSPNQEKTSYMVSEVIQQAGYEIIPVHPSADEVLGVKAVPSLKDIKGHVDIVNVFRRPEHLPEIAKEAVEIQADVFWAQQGIVNQVAYDYLKDHGVTVIMDRCIKVEHAMLK